MPLRVAEYIAQALVQHGVRHVFLMTGGGAMFLNDALGHQPGLAAVCFHHEQAAAMAAEASARIRESVGVLNVTTGPGGINALNGVFGAWTDSIPLLVISGQVKRETSLRHMGLRHLRQLGDQEADIVALAQPICKYVAFVDDPGRIRFELEKALHLAEHGRPGPCWLDIPLDVQSALVAPETLPGFVPEPDAAPPAAQLAAQCQEILARLAASQRPVILAGSGIRAARATAIFERVTARLGVPVATAWTHDLIASDDPLFCGRPGTIGTRAGNFAVQNADFLLTLGSRLNIRQTGYNWASFAKNAFRAQVDIDSAELEKPSLATDLPIQADLNVFLTTLEKCLPNPLPAKPAHQAWQRRCKDWLREYPNVRPPQRQICAGRINPYHFIETLFGLLEADDIVACANAAACIVPFQAGAIKRGMRLFSNSGCASMGYGLPAAIGAYYGAMAARGQQKRVICLEGDGSIMLNLQELQTVAHHRLPLKIFILDNGGYLSIRSSQANFFGRLTGESPASGVSFPDFVALGKAFGLSACELAGEDFAARLPELLADAAPMLAVVRLDATQGFEPRMSSRQLPDGRIVSPALEDMFPFLPPEELARNMRNSANEVPSGAPR
ncbi:MAG: thiamine pyrophosphate-binding protein [Zoogloeaceae bacterium]|jgi:acetolactate synthase-1/2/3 large subunit|nr:thiamine pyrophosphate-binding protein [Zoogloeaceae bacterium]